MENYDYIRTNLEQIEKSSNLNESSPYKYTNPISNNFVSKIRGWQVFFLRQLSLWHQSQQKRKTLTTVF